jgi:hypothetical protein
MAIKTGQVFVYKIARPSASKITEIINGKNQKRLNQTKIDGKIKETFQVPLSGSTRKLATGLDKEVDNPLKGEQINNPAFQFLATQDKALLQHLIEYKYNFDKGYLNSIPADINNKKHLENPSFYQTFRYKLNDGLTVLNLNNIDDLLAYYSMLEHHRFANSKKEWEAGKFPSADYYLAEMDETENEKYSKKQYKDRAKSELSLGKVADSDTQKKFVKLLLPQISKGRLTDAQAYNALSEGIDNNERYKDGEEFIVKYNKLVKLLQDAPGKARFNALVLLQEGVNTYVLTDKGGTYNWVAKDLIIGASKEKAIDWILDPNKADLVQELEEQVITRKDKYELI